MGARTRNSTASSSSGRSAQPEAARKIGAVLAELWPEATCEIDHQNAYQLLVGTILAAQSTDKIINTVTPALFARYPDATALAAAEPELLEQMVHSTGFFRMKAKHLLGMARAVVERHGGEIPQAMEALVALPGVARKTANVVLGTAFGKAEGIVVDTHVTRLSAKLGLTTETDPVKIEDDLQQLLPRSEWVTFPNRLIWHGRRVCFARKPACESCGLAPLCPSAELPGTAAKSEKPETSKPETSKPETSKPETSKPKTSKTETSKPKTSKRGAGSDKPQKSRKAGA
jgi:endonuclease-3